MLSTVLYATGQEMTTWVMCCNASCSRQQADICPEMTVTTGISVLQAAGLQTGRFWKNVCEAVICSRLHHGNC